MRIQYPKEVGRNLVTHTAWGIAIHHWLYLLWKNKFNIHFRSWPKVFFITVNALMNAPVQCFEYYRFRSRINRVRVERPVFIIGHHRSGTTYLHYLLSKDPEFAWCTTLEGLIPYTFLSLGTMIQGVLQHVMPATRPQDNVTAGATLPIEEEFAMGNISRTSLVHGYYFPQSIYQTFDESVLFNSHRPEVLRHWKSQFLFFVRKLVYKHGGKKIILKSPANTARIKELLDLFPDARFIHIYRNPYEVYQSTVNLYEKILPILGFQRIESEFMNEFVLYAYENLYRKFLLDKSLIPSGQIIEFSYEDFVASPLSCLQRAYKHLELGSFESVRRFMEEEIKVSRDYKTNVYTSIPDDVREVIKTRWRFAFDAFGYKP